jgi:hypothetical protein
VEGYEGCSVGGALAVKSQPAMEMQAIAAASLFKTLIGNFIGIPWLIQIRFAPSS